MKVNEIDEGIELLKRLKKEEVERQDSIKQRLLDMLSREEENYYLIIKDDVENDFKVYGMRGEDVEDVYNQCEELIDREDEDNIQEHFILTKEEVKKMVYALENNIIRQTRGKDNA